MKNLVAAFVIALSCAPLAGCAVEMEDDGIGSDSSDVVSIEIGNASAKSVSGYIVYSNIDKEFQDVHNQPIPSGTVNLYTWFGTSAGQVDVDYYQEHGTVRRRMCEEIKDIRNPFRDGRLRYASYMCRLELTTVEAPHGSGYVLIEYEEIDETDDSLTGEISYPYVSVEDGRATVTEKLPIQDRPHPTASALQWVPAGKSFAVEAGDFVIMQSTDNNGNRGELRFQYVNY